MSSVASVSSAQGRLGAWLRARAARDRVVALEEALLGGAFWRYALRRLSVFAFARLWATALHVIELAFLSEIFSARPFVASLALQNATLIADAFWWGALETLRRRLRVIGVRTQAQVLTTRYMTIAFAVGLCGCGVPLARLAWRWHAEAAAPTMLDAYAFICLLRLALDMVLRTLYSGVYAYGRVHRAIWSAPVSPTLLVGVTVALWPWLAGWSFVVALLVSVLASRALLLRFTLRAYRHTRVPLPVWRWHRLGRTADWRLLGESALAGVANLTTRLASVVLLGAVLPSLGGDDGQVQMVAYVLHLSAPLMLATSQWSFIFYHDWKRLEADVAAVLARRLHLGLLAVGACIAVIAWAATVLLVWAFIGGQWAPVTPVLISLAPTYLGLAIWTTLQLRGFSRGEFASQALSAVVIIGAVAASGAAAADRDLWYWTLAGCPWLAVAAHALFARWLRAPVATNAATLDGWIDLLRRQRRPLVVWRAQLAGSRSAALAEEVRRALARRDCTVPVRQWLFGFEGHPGAGPAAWVVRCAGLLSGLETCSVPSGAAAVEELVRRGWLTAPARALDVDGLERAHADLFPSGFTLHVGRRPPRAFAALPPDVRQAIWRDAIRRATGARRRTSAASPDWRVTALAPGGQLTHVFVAPRVPAAADGLAADRAWAQRLQPATWQAAPPRRASDASPRGAC